MAKIKFDQFAYFPSLRSSPGEHMGYRELGAGDKDALLPIFELSQRGNPANLDDAQQVIRESAAQRPFILSLCSEPAPPPYVPVDPTDEQLEKIERSREAQQSYNQLLARLLDSSDGFSAWRNLARGFPNAIPMLQFSDVVTQQRQILRQAAFLSRDGNSVAIQITQEAGPQAVGLIASIVSVLESPDQLLLVLDCGQGRQQIGPRSQFAVETIAAIQQALEVSERPLVQAVCMSNSFPKPGDGLRTSANLDWRLWRASRDGFRFAFGDYGSIHRIPRASFVPTDIKPTVVLPMDESWLIYRHVNANDDEGWIIGSKQISDRPEFADAPDVWGTTLMRRAAAGDIQDINQPRYWYGARVNIHLHRQIKFARASLAAFGSDDEPPEP